MKETRVYRNFQMWNSHDGAVELGATRKPLLEAVFPTWWSVSFLFFVAPGWSVSPFSLLGDFHSHFMGQHVLSACFRAGPCSLPLGEPWVFAVVSPFATKVLLPASCLASSRPTTAPSLSSRPSSTPRLWCLLLGSVLVTGCASGCSSGPLPLTGSYSVQEALAISHTLGSLHSTYFDPVETGRSNSQYGPSSCPWMATVFLPVDGHRLAMSVHAKQSEDTGLFIILQGHSSQQRGTPLMTSSQPNYLAKAYLQIASFWRLGLQVRNLERERHRYSPQQVVRLQRHRSRPQKERERQSSHSLHY